MTKGIDSPLDCSKKAAAVAAAGYAYVGRYYRKHTSNWAPLTSSEVAALHQAGLAVVALWEADSAKLSYFSYTAGVDDGSSAYHQALHAGQPPSTPIYFAVDFDASLQQILGPVADYFKGVASGFQAVSMGKPAYRVGVYGSGRTCAWLKAHALADSAWLAMSEGWAGADYAEWQLKQHEGNKALEFDHDEDESQGEFGSF